MCDEKCAALAMALIDIDELAASKGDSEKKFSEAAAEIIANLRNHNRDLQQAYDHVLECEQNRCREVVELQDWLAEVTAERDELRRRIDEAPVWYMENGGFVSDYAASFRSDKQNLTRVRLVRDDQPGETDA